MAGYVRASACSKFSCFLLAWQNAVFCKINFEIFIEWWHNFEARLSVCVHTRWYDSVVLNCCHSSIGHGSLILAIALHILDCKINWMITLNSKHIQTHAKCNHVLPYSERHSLVVHGIAPSLKAKAMCSAQAFSHFCFARVFWQQQSIEAGTTSWEPICVRPTSLNKYRKLAYFAHGCPERQWRLAKAKVSWQTQ